MPEGENAFVDAGDFGDKLIRFLKRNAIRSGEELVKCLVNYQRKIGGQTHPLTVDALAGFLQKNAFPEAGISEVTKYAKMVDIDGDWVVSSEDAETFLERINYIVYEEESEKSEVRNTFAKSDGLRLFPRKSLTNEQLESVLREIRLSMAQKKIQPKELFATLDSNQDGFITITEFAQNIDKIASFSSQIKDGLFARMDAKGIGMVDFASFNKILNTSLIDLKEKKEDKDENEEKDQAENDWIWTKRIVQQIRDWFRDEKLTLEDGFRSFDKDFDGVINKEDLRYFLMEVLKCQKQDLNQARVNRLFKMMDEHKRGILQITDLKKILSGAYLQNYNFSLQGKEQTVWGKQSESDKLWQKDDEEAVIDAEWIKHAKQQIGLTLSRKFESIQQSFESNTDSINSISQHQKKIVYKQFSSWIEKSRALVGFDLVSAQLQQVFASLDPHKKGFISENDWANQFAQYSWKGEMSEEIKETLQQSFESKQSAFDYFAENGKFITYGTFEKGVRSLFNNRFTHSDIQSLWFKLSNKSDCVINRETFYQTLFSPDFPEKITPNEKKEFTRTRPVTAPVGAAKNRLKLTNGSASKQSQETTESQAAEEGRLIVEKLKQLMRLSSRSIEDMCIQADAEDTGKLSIVEFKNVLRNLNVNLTAKEMDKLIGLCDDSTDGTINWKGFIEKFKIKESVSRIIDRSKQRLQKMCEDIHYYMISPIDAFRLFNEDRNGKLTFEQFNSLVNRLCKMAREQLPSFAIIKDLFQIIDTRKDGIIDTQEWVQTFAKYQAPDAALQGKPIALTQPEQPRKLVKPLFLSTQKTINANTLDTELLQYDELIVIIAKNRKFLLGQFKEIDQKEPLTYERTLDVIHKMFVGLGKNLDHSCYAKLLKFAERDGIIDYKFLLDVYKERLSKINMQPNMKTH